MSSFKPLGSIFIRRLLEGLTERPEGLLTMGASLLTSSVAKVEVTLGMAGIDLLNILSNISFVA
jgi:hypothetical protein